MEKIVGQITSKNSKKKYWVRHHTVEKSVSISEDKLSWITVCKNVTIENDAVLCAQKYIDLQKYLF